MSLVIQIKFRIDKEIYQKNYCNLNLCYTKVSGSLINRSIKINKLKSSITRSSFSLHFFFLIQYPIFNLISKKVTYHLKVICLSKLMKKMENVKI